MLNIEIPNTQVFGINHELCGVNLVINIHTILAAFNN